MFRRKEKNNVKIKIKIEPPKSYPSWAGNHSSKPPGYDSRYLKSSWQHLHAPDYTVYKEREGAVLKDVAEKYEAGTKCPVCESHIMTPIQHFDHKICPHCDLLLVNHGNALDIRSGSEKTDAYIEARLQRKKAEKPQAPLGSLSFPEEINEGGLSVCEDDSVENAIDQVDRVLKSISNLREKISKLK